MSTVTTAPLLIEHDAPDSRTQQSPPSIAAAIPTLNGGPRLLEMLEALFLQQLCGARLEVLIADSQSDDGSIDEVRRRFPSVRLFTVERQRFNHGLVRSALVKAARAPLVAMFSQDAVPVGEHYLTTMATALDRDHVAGVYARQVPRAGADPLVREMLNRWTPAPLDGAPAAPRLQQLSRDQQLGTLSPQEQMQLARFDNVASMVRADVVLSLPFPARDFGEDIAWGARVLAAGLSLAYLPTACVEHHHDPMIGETFRRNRLAHRQAHSEFGLHSVPDLRRLALALIAGVPGDFKQGPIWALRGLPRRGAALLGQWAGARDAARTAPPDSEQPATIH